MSKNNIKEAQFLIKKLEETLKNSGKTDEQIKTEVKESNDKYTSVAKKLLKSLIDKADDFYDENKVPCENLYIHIIDFNDLLGLGCSEDKELTFNPIINRNMLATGKYATLSNGANLYVDKNVPQGHYVAQARNDDKWDVKPIY
jgi:hypothetical protein